MDIDKELILRRFGASFGDYDKRADVQRDICEKLAKQLDEVLLADAVNTMQHCIRVAPILRDDYQPKIRKSLEIGAGTGFLTKRMVERWPHAEWFINDLSPESEHFIAPIFYCDDDSGPPPPTFIWGDAESVEFPASLDLIASASTVQWFADMPAFVAKAAAALNSGGVLALSSFGPENFREIRAAAATGLDYLTLAQLTALIEDSGLRIMHADEWTQTLDFDTPRDVLRYIKTLGLNALSPKNYIKGFDSTRLTYHPLIVIAKK